MFPGAALAPARGASGSTPWDRPYAAQMAALQHAESAHRARWGTPHLVARGPGRVNLIGEHTDYNDGFALPMALPFETVVALSSHGDAEHDPIEVVSEGFGELTYLPGAWPCDVPEWARYVVGVVELLSARGIPCGGWRAALAGDVPSGAGLSSSASLEVALITALLGRAGITWPAVEVARVGQATEHQFAGTPCGLMDQYISAGAVAGAASLIDFRTFDVRTVPVPDDVVVAVMDTGTRRRLAEGRYAERRDSCTRAAAALGLTSLRDATPDVLPAISDEVDRARARHIVTENRRTLDCADALAVGDLATAGEAFDESHASMRDDFAISSPALDALVAAARRAPGCIGARMTGGGFAGCAVSLVERGAAEAFRSAVIASGAATDVWMCTPAPGAALVPSAG